MSSTEQPFSGFPHIFKQDDVYLEVCCPFCGGNTCAHSPFAFFEDLNAFTGHIGRAHKGNNTNATDLLSQTYNTKLRILSKQDVDKIIAGGGKDVITKKAGVKEKDNGTDAKVVEYSDDYPFVQYPTVFKKGDGTYVELRCSECSGNVVISKGSYASPNPRLVFFAGADAISKHTKQVHKKKASVKWVEANCGTVITAQRFDELKNDQTGKLIPRVDATPAETKENAKIRRKTKEEEARERKRIKEENNQRLLTGQPVVTKGSTEAINSDVDDNENDEDKSFASVTTTTKPAQRKRKINEGERSSSKRVRQATAAGVAFKSINSASDIMSASKEQQDKRARLRGTDGNRVEDSATTMAEYQNQRFGFGYAKGYKSHGWAPFNQRAQASSEDASIEEV
ncbi:hypothetical protein LTR37_013200 [Vermiconidia calcicola]|uniref:Uncharacterized protein n=1 Tax=Vermiconidia calcicola TaxID=1690605 RepID=A0ACC3MZU4_9PEZI|nr:hypothetical protein LTR37_013200 [Vermiconidia calcicola]